MRHDLFPSAPNYAAASFPTPREFQRTAHKALRQGFNAGHRCQVLMAPTGAGKTYLGLLIAHEALVKGKRVVFVCDRTTLINQTSATAEGYGLGDHGILQAQNPRNDSSMPFQIASAQTIQRRRWPAADVIIVDECHTLMKAWVDHIPTTHAAVIGLSATPFSAGLGKLFTRLVNATTMHDLTRQGVLVPMRVLSCTRPDMTGAKLNIKGEWDENAAAERGMGIVGDVVSEWVKHGQSRKTIVFGSNIAHCEELARQFNEAGVMAAVFTSHTDEKERLALLNEYRKPDSALRILISVEALAKGFDVPDVGCVVDCRPLRKSLSTAIQMWGRGLRSSPDTGKTDCILLDHSGNILRFREDFEAVYFNGLEALDDGEKLDKAVRKEPEEQKAPKGCPVCGYRPFAKRCMACGHEVQKASLVEAEAGSMREIVMLGGKKMGEDRAHVWAQAVAYARANSRPEKQQGRAAHIFHDITGSWPARGWSVETTPHVEITRPVLNKIRQKNIAWNKAREVTA
jgi:superfamily II DNA or RNA helicase